MDKREELTKLVFEHPEIIDRVLALMRTMLEHRPLDPSDEREDG